MTDSNDTEDRLTKWMRWVARLWSLPLVAFALIMLVGSAWNLATTGKADPYAVEGYPPTEAAPPFLLFLSVVGLGIAWRWERLGGAINLVLVVAALALLLVQRPITQDLARSGLPYLLSLSVAIPGVLFLACGWRSQA